MRSQNQFPAAPPSFSPALSPPSIRFACPFSPEVPSVPCTYAHPTDTLWDTTTRLASLYSCAQPNTEPPHRIIRPLFAPEETFLLPLCPAPWHPLERDSVYFSLVCRACTYLVATIAKVRYFQLRRPTKCYHLFYISVLFTVWVRRFLPLAYSTVGYQSPSFALSIF